MKASYLVLIVMLAGSTQAAADDLFDLLGPAEPSATKQVSHTFPAGPSLAPSLIAESADELDGAKSEEPEPLRVAQVEEAIPVPAEVIRPLETNQDLATAWGVPAVVAPQPTKSSPLFRPIVSLTLDMGADPELVKQGAGIPDKFAIKDLAAEAFGEWDTPRGELSLAATRFAPTDFRFAAPAVYSRPLYFEQANLERYGHHVALCERDNLSQSALSAAHFFATVPALPYKMGTTRPDECSYVLGVYRPGSCNPHQLLRPELSVSGLTWEGAIATGLVFMIP